MDRAKDQDLGGPERAAISAAKTITPMLKVKAIDFNEGSISRMSVNEGSSIFAILASRGRAW
jgi:hypothetical protein